MFLTFQHEKKTWQIDNGGKYCTYKYYCTDAQQPQAWPTFKQSVEPRRVVESQWGNQNVCSLCRNQDTCSFNLASEALCVNLLTNGKASGAGNCGRHIRKIIKTFYIRFMRYFLCAGWVWLMSFSQMRQRWTKSEVASRTWPLFVC